MSDDVNKTVLVAIMNNKRDFAIAREKHWYRVPVKSAPRNLRELLVQQVAFYFTKHLRMKRIRSDGSGMSNELQLSGEEICSLMRFLIQEVKRIISRLD